MAAYTDLQVGDRVRITGGARQYRGYEGKIVSITDTRKSATVDLGTGKPIMFRVKSLTIVYQRRDDTTPTHNQTLDDAIIALTNELTRLLRLRNDAMEEHDEA